jgi:lipopolysaccharide/colanic/teichoic acid biosynthesis glycosyltransferase
MTAKRLFDLCCTVPGIVVLSPVFVTVAVLIKLDSRGPLFFQQVRIGQFGRPFKIIKFRTMRVHSDEGLHLTIGKDKRITRVGYFLRQYKLDELPQLLNVLKGEMSLVGPRPEVPEYVALYPDNIRDFVLSVPVGITDYASIEFSNESEILATSLQPEVDYVEKILPIKLAYHQLYVKEHTLLLDIRLILKTLKRILF